MHCFFNDCGCLIIRPIACLWAFNVFFTINQLTTLRPPIELTISSCPVLRLPIYCITVSILYEKRFDAGLVNVTGSYSFAHISVYTLTRNFQCATYVAISTGVGCKVPRWSLYVCATAWCVPCLKRFCTGTTSEFTFYRRKDLDDCFIHAVSLKQ